MIVLFTKRYSNSLNWRMLKRTFTVPLEFEEILSFKYEIYIKKKVNGETSFKDV